MTNVFSLRSGAIGGGGGGLTGATYYIDPSGSDANDGRSAATPWKTIAKANAQIYSPGDTVLLKRDGTYYTGGFRLRGSGQLQLPGLSSKITIKDYGSGALPIISAWKILTPAGWSLHATGVWKINVNVDITGNTMTLGAAGANIGRLLVDGAIKTIKCLNLGDLTNDWDYYSDNVTTLYVRSDLNPSTRATEIKASPSIGGGVIGDSVSSAWRNLQITGSGGHGANVAVSDVDIQWCWFNCIGGSVLGNDNTQPRYGNGVESFASGSRIVARNNFFVECFDVAVTAQGYPMNKATSGWNDIDFSDNWIARCAWGVEFWAAVSNPYVAGQLGPTGSGFNNVRARRLRLWDIGRGSSRLGRYTGQLWSVFVQTTDIQTPYQPLSVSISEMHNCSDNLLFFNTPTGRRSTTDFVIEPSSLSLPTGSRIMRGTGQPTYTVEQWANFVADTGIGVGSTMTIEANGQSLTPISTIYDLWQSTLFA